LKKIKEDLINSLDRMDEQKQALYESLKNKKKLHNVCLLVLTRNCQHCRSMCIQINGIILETVQSAKLLYVCVDQC